MSHATEANTPSAAKYVLSALGYMRELGLAQKLCLILWLKIMFLETLENWGNLGIMKTDGMIVLPYI